MMRLDRRWFGALMCVVVFPGAAQAQAVAPSFDELQQILKVGDTVAVTDDSGQRTKGKVAEISASSLILAGRERQTFGESTITTIRRTDSVWNGMLIGLGVGAAVFLAGSGIENDPGVYYWLYIGSWLFPATGAITGTLIDRARGNEPIYVKSSQRTVSVSPWRNTKGTGVSLSLRF